jgi:hypothetical protein
MLFNHSIELRRVRPSGQALSLAYDDAFGERRRAHMSFGHEVDHVRIGGTASSDVIVQSAMVLEYIEDKEHIVVVAQDGHRYSNCIRSRHESFYIGQPVLLVEHMDHDPGCLDQFDYLVTAHNADFRLNSIRVMTYDVFGHELEVVHVDPYTGQINYDDRLDSSRI